MIDNQKRTPYHPQVNDTIKYLIKILEHTLKKFGMCKMMNGII